VPFHPTTQLLYRPTLRTGLAILYLTLLCVQAIYPQTGLAAQTDLDRIGQGDPRSGYESEAFVTDSKSLAGTTGIRADLAALAASPPLGLPALPTPPAGSLVDLGRRLFFDRRLSANQTISCGMCHVPEQAFTQNELATPVGIEGRFVRRNAPALYNVGYRRLLFHDGRETDLVQQIWAPLLAVNEMGNRDRAAVLDEISADPSYRTAFNALFSDGITDVNLGRALAAYQRALLSADSPFDRWFFGGNTDAITEQAKRGFFQFNEAGCNRCHRFTNDHAHFTDDDLHRTGVEHASRAREALPVDRIQIAPGVVVPLEVSVPVPARNDDGQMEVTGEPADRWRYRTPSLRNVALTAPYMHDGSLRTLKDVIEFYDGGSGADPGRDPALVPLSLDDTQKKDLIAFLESLTGSNVDELAADARSTPIGDRQHAPTDTKGDD
jgi:cytochrome c peroxidase